MGPRGAPGSPHHHAGGQNPLWAHSGSELFFIDAERGLVAAEVEADSVFRVLRSQALFDASDYFLTEGSDYYVVEADWNDDRAVGWHPCEAASVCRR